MSNRIMQLTKFEIHEGKLEACKESIRKAVAIAEATGPQLLVEVYIDDQAMRAHSCQAQPDSKARPPGSLYREIAGWSGT